MTFTNEMMAIFLYAPIPTFLLDEKGMILRANRVPASRTEGHTASPGGLGLAIGCVYALQGKGVCGGSETGPHCGVCSLRTRILETLKTERIFHRIPCEIPFEEKDPNKRVHLLLSTIPLWLESKKRVLVYIEDVSDLQNARREVESLNRTLEQKVREKTEQVRGLLRQKESFIGQLGHDLRTPLTPLIALLPLILSRVDDPKAREMLNVVLSNAHYMQDLVEKTLKLIFLDQQPEAAMEAQPVNLSGLLQRTVQDIQSTMDQHTLSIHVEADTPFWILGDEVHLREMILNLLTNAMKFTPAGGRITTRIRGEGDQVMLSVRDTGIGIPSDKLHRIFEEFFKVDASRHDRQSSGLGLSICKRIIEHHGGQIRASSAGENQGTTIAVLLPCCPPPRDNTTTVRFGEQAETDHPIGQGVVNHG
jgi:signal transduction histidine kinase